MNFTDVREAVNFTITDTDTQIMNTTLTITPVDELALADNIVYNDTETREIDFVVNYKDTSRGRDVVIEGL